VHVLSLIVSTLEFIVIDSLKGGDPAAPSGTATLLRLSASYQLYLRRTPPQGLE
jgi:hypothetical protein